MNFKGIYYSLTFRLALAIGLTAALTYQALEKEWGWFLFLGIGWLAALRGISLLFKRNAQKVAFMFDAIDNSDYAFKYATRGRSSNDKLVSDSLNRITQILFQAKAEAIQKEKYYELIMNQVNTGIIVEDDKGNIFQTNNEALRLLGLTVFTHARQLGRIDENLERLISDVRPGEKHQISFINERGTVHLSVRVSEMTLQEKHVRIIAINDINSELDDKEIDSWIRLTRVLTHEIMNSIAPVISLSETVAERATINGMNERDYAIMVQAMQTIHRRSKGLLDFVENYRQLTRLPLPTLRNFSVSALFDDIRLLFPEKSDILFFRVKPEDLNLYADRIMVEQVLINLLKNAIEACEESLSPQIVVEAVQKAGMVIISVIDNGSGIVPEAIDKVFVPFFTTKSKCSGIGLSLCRQIMNRHGGSISLDSQVEKGSSFVLRFPIVTKRIL